MLGLGLGLGLELGSEGEPSQIKLGKLIFDHGGEPCQIRTSLRPPTSQPPSSLPAHSLPPAAKLTASLQPPSHSKLQRCTASSSNSRPEVNWE